MLPPSGGKRRGGGGGGGDKDEEEETRTRRRLPNLRLHWPLPSSAHRSLPPGVVLIFANVVAVEEGKEEEDEEDEEAVFGSETSQAAPAAGSSIASACRCLYCRGCPPTMRRECALRRGEAGAELRTPPTSLEHTPPSSGRRKRRRRRTRRQLRR